MNDAFASDNTAPATPEVVAAIAAMTEAGEYPAEF